VTTRSKNFGGIAPLAPPDHAMTRAPWWGACGPGNVEVKTFTLIKDEGSKRDVRFGAIKQREERAIELQAPRGTNVETKREEDSTISQQIARCKRTDERNSNSKKVLLLRDAPSHVSGNPRSTLYQWIFSSPSTSCRSAFTNSEAHPSGAT